MLAHIADEPVLQATSSGAARTSTPRPPAPIFGTAPEKLDRGMRSKAKMVNYGIVYGLSAYGLADRLQIEQEEAQEFIDALPRALPGGRSSSSTDDDRPRPTSDGLRDARCSAAAARSPSCARATGRRASSASGSRSTRSSRAPRRTSSRSRWCAAHDALRDAGLADPAASCRSTTSCCSRARPTRPTRRPRSSRREMVGAVRDGPAARGRRRASARTGWTRSRWTEGAGGRADRRRRAGWSRCRRRSTPSLGKAVGTFRRRRSRSRSACRARR